MTVKKQTVYIYFHADLDGVTSAFLMKKVLEADGYNPEYGGYLKYDASVKENWREYPFKRPFVIIDFQYHPDALGYIDHHETHKVDCDLSGLKYCIFDKTAKACTSLVLRLAEERGVKLSRVRRFVRQSEIVDSADYAGYGIDPMEYILPEKGFLRVTRAIEEDSAIIDTILDDLESMKWADRFDWRLEAVARQRDVKKIIADLKPRVRKSLAEFKTVSRVVGQTVIFDFHGQEYFRYLPAVVYPQSKYWFGLIDQEDSCSIKLNFNPWFKGVAKNTYDMGAIAKEYGGGGHEDVGAIPILEGYDKAAKVFTEIITKLHLT
ncbi:TPA: hypothetical protein DF272_03915 [Candidatus Falkowbacteria bacterium]|nr:hypothetical protein [Candidatus Falkowbacteria bacterium]